MKIFKIIVLLIVFISFLPLEAFCENHHAETDRDHHCALVCHGCHNIIMADTKMFLSPDKEILKFSFDETPHYQNPVLANLFRPPKNSPTL